MSVIEVQKSKFGYCWWCIGCCGCLSWYV